MDLVLVVLTAPTPEAGTRISSQILSDILWANADPADGLQHINVRAEPKRGGYAVGMFLLPGHHFATEPPADRVLRLCHKAIDAAPVLSGWSSALIPRS